MAGADLTGATLHETYLGDAFLGSVTLADLSLAGHHLQRLWMTGATLQNVDLTGADLTGVRLAAAKLIQVDLTGADLSKAHLTGAEITACVLHRADLTGADLTGVVVQDSDFSGSNFTEVVGSYAEVRGARLPLAPLPLNSPDMVARFGVPGGGGVEVCKVQRGEVSPRQLPTTRGTLVLFIDPLEGVDAPSPAARDLADPGRLLSAVRKNTQDAGGLGLQEGRDSLMWQEDYVLQVARAGEQYPRVEVGVVHLDEGYASQADHPAAPRVGVVYVDRYAEPVEGNTDSEIVEMLTQELKAYDAWTREDIYRVVWEDEDGDQYQEYAFGSWTTQLQAWHFDPQGYEEAEGSDPEADPVYQSGY